MEDDDAAILLQDCAALRTDIGIHVVAARDALDEVIDGGGDLLKAEERLLFAQAVTATALADLNRYWQTADAYRHALRRQENAS